MDPGSPEACHRRRQMLNLAGQRPARRRCAAGRLRRWSQSGSHALFAMRPSPKATGSTDASGVQDTSVKLVPATSHAAPGASNLTSRKHGAEAVAPRAGSRHLHPHPPQRRRWQSRSKVARRERVSCSRAGAPAKQRRQWAWLRLRALRAEGLGAAAARSAKVWHATTVGKSGAGTALSGRASAAARSCVRHVAARRQLTVAKPITQQPWPATLWHLAAAHPYQQLLRPTRRRWRCCWNSIAPSPRHARCSGAPGSCAVGWHPS